MKKILFALVLICMFGLSSCRTKGDCTTLINGSESNLPDELKGMKVYKVATGILGTIKVAVIGNTTSTTYPVGKSTETAILYSVRNSDIKTGSGIMFENDEIIIIKK